MGPAAWFVSGMCLAVPAVAHAAPDPDTEPAFASPRRIPGLFVKASEFPGNATVITSQDIARSTATSVPELLGQYEGVHVMDTNGFGLGADAGVTVRGITNGSRTNALVLLNGVRQNRVTGDEVHWQAIPLEQVERIEILRGGGSILYGEGALGGVINITTKRDSERRLETESGAAAGSYGQQRYAFSARGRSSPIRYGVSYSRDLIGGYREQTSSRTTTVTSGLGYDVLPSLRIQADVLHSEDTSRFAGGITPQASQQRRRQPGSFPGFFDETTDQVSLETTWLGSSGFSAVAQAFWRMRESDSITAGDLRFASLTPSKGLSLRSSSEQVFGDVKHTLISGVELLDEKASTGFRGGGLSESNKSSYGLFAQDTLRFYDRVSLMAGARYDRARFEEDIAFPSFVGTLRFEGWSPTAGLSVEVLEPLTLYANFARPFKAPNVDDFSAVVPTGFVGNISLQPQQGADYEVGLRFHDARRGSARLAWFSIRTDDEILFNDLPGNDQNQNFDTVRTGLETSLSPALPLERLSGTLTYTFMEAEFRKGVFKDHTLPGVPEHRMTAQLTYEPVRHVFCSLDWILVHDFFRINDFNNVSPGDNYGVLNAAVRLVYDPVTVYLKIANLTSEEYTTFQSSDGVTTSTGENPASPISFLGGVTVKF